MNDIFTYGVTPEEVGLSSARVESVFRRLVDRKFLSHSLLIARHGKVIAEGYFAPFRRDDRHRMYSTSKSFTSTAIGMLIGEGRLALDDKIVKFFPEECEKFPPDRWLAETTVRDLLVMSTPHDAPSYSFDRDDWVESFFKRKTARPSGSNFNYDTAGTFILDAIIEKLAGKPYMDYLYDVLLGEAGSSENVYCVQSPDGYSWGGSGVLCTTRDLARLGQIYLDKGTVHGKQLLPREFAEEAVKRQIDNNLTGHIDLMHGHGYGYQIWCCDKGCFGFYGMGGQVVIACPETGLLLAATSDEQGASTGYHYLFELFYRDLREPLLESGKDRLPADPAAYRSLCETTASLACPLPLIGEEGGVSGEKYLGKTFRLAPNRMGIETISVTRDGKSGVLRFHARGEDKEIPFGFGHYEIATFPETGYDGPIMGKPMGRGYRTMSAALWTEESKLVIRSYLIDDYFGNLAVTLCFKGSELVLQMCKTAEHFLNEYSGWAIGVLEESGE